MAVKEKAPLPLVPKSIKAVLYARVSSEEQREKQTIQDQRTAAREWSERKGVTIEKVYTDDGVSGMLDLDKRPAGRQLLADAKRGFFNLVVFRELERIGRSVEIIHAARNQIESASVTLHSITEGFDLATLGGEVHFGVSAVFAQYARKQFLERSRAGWLRAARENRWTNGHPPYGYKIGDDGRLVIIPSEATVVKKIFSLATHGLPLAAIAKRLWDDEIPSPNKTPGKERRRNKPNPNYKSVIRSGGWHTSMISYLLHRTVYRGEITMGGMSKRADRVLITQQTPAIISPEQWHQAQVALKNRQQFAKRNAHREYLLSSMIRCGFCNRRLQAKTMGPHSWYRCAGLMGETRNLLTIPCNQKTLSMGWLDDIVWSDLASWIANHADLEAEVREAFTRQEQDRSEWSATLKRARLNLGTAEKQRERLLHAYRKGIISDNDLEQQMNDLRAEMNHVEIVAQEMERKLSEALDVDGVVAGIKKTLSAFRASLRKGTVPFAVKRQIVETFVSEVMVSIPKGLDLPKTTKVPLRSRLPFRPHEDHKAIPVASGEGIRVYQRGTKKQEPQPELIRIDYRFPILEPHSLMPIVSKTDNRSMLQL